MHQQTFIKIDHTVKHCENTEANMQMVSGDITHHDKHTTAVALHLPCNWMSRQHKCIIHQLYMQ